VSVLEIDASPDFRPFPREALEGSLWGRFTEVARRSPWHAAVAGEGRSFTYEEVEYLARRIAAALIARGQGSPVAVLLDHEPRLVPAILGVLASGAAYVPLDPALPLDRLRFILDDAGPGAVLCSPETSSLASALAVHAVVVDVTRDLPGAGAEAEATATDPAYVYYTTGTTGSPKGVVDCHRNVLHNILRYTNRLKIAPGDRLTLLQRPGFSGAVSSMFGALLNGATACLVDPARAGQGLGAWLQHERVTVYHSVPALFRLAVSSRADLSSVRVVRLEGDRATIGDFELFRERLGPGAVLANGLGATECGLVRQFLARRDTIVEHSALPIGYAVPDIHVSLIGDGGEEVGAGEIGEIAVTSRYLALGYWRRPELTAERFRAVPGDTALREYRTGDLGRLHEDGCLEYLGRRDQQVKVRGHRVEVEAIERRLLASSLVREAAVGIVERPGREPAVLAAVVPAAGAPPTTGALRHALRGLPAWNVPGRFVVVDSLPLNENGKVDVSRLVDGLRTRPQLDTDYLPPASILQAQLAQLWEELLGVSPVGCEDPFEELGGDSLLAAELLAELSDLVGRELPYSVVVGNRTILELAGALLSERPLDDGPVIELAAGEPGAAPILWVHGDFTGGGLYSRRLGAALAPHPFYSVMPHGFLGSAVPASLEQMADERVEAVRKLLPSGPYVVGGHCNLGGRVALEMARRLERGGAPVTIVLVGSAPPPGGPAVMRAARAARVVTAVAARLLRIDPGREAALFAAMRNRALALLRIDLGERETTETWRAWNRALDSYVQRRYHRAIELLWPDGERYPASDAIARWRSVGVEARVSEVPGTHLTVVTTHLPELVEAVRDVLARSDALR